MRDVVLSIISICLLLLIVVLVLMSSGGGESAPPIPPEQIRTLASALESQGLHDQAVSQYKKYLNAAVIPVEQRANILYRIGSLYLDNLHDYENALASFLEISHLYPQSRIAPEAEKRMVRCFEEMQRGGDAQRKLKQLTDLEAEEEEGTGPLVAQIGDRRITRDQLERELNQMPENQRKYYDDPQKRRQYLQSKLFEELLYDMALRKEYQKDREIRQQMRRVEKMMLAQKVLREEVNDKIRVSDGDIELYYKANLDDFKIPLTAKIAHILTSSKDKAEEAQKAVGEGMAFEQAVQQYSEDGASKSKNGSIGTISQGSQYVPTVGQAPEIVKQLLALDAQAVSESIQSEKGFHLFKILEKTPERIQPLDEVKTRVQALVGQRKAAELQDSLLQRLLKAEKVKIFDQTLVEPAKAAASSQEE